MSARFVPLNGGDQPIVLQRPVLLVGRHPECDARIDRPQVSRRHCCVAQAYDRLTIRDLGSRNGVRVNGKTITEARLQHGDEIAIAQIIYRLEDDTPPPEAPAVASQPKPESLPDLSASDDDPILDFGLVPLDDD